MNEATQDTPPQNLILVGFMGCGKSTIGHHLHKELQYPHLDTDQLIEQREGKSIPQIFKEKGEAHFRTLETQLLEELVQAQPQCHIISTGGGLPLKPENRALLQQLGFVIWLDAEPDAIFERVSRNQNRPLLKTANPRETVLKLLSDRRPIYEESSHIKIKTDSLNFSEITYGVIESAKVFFSSLQCGE